MNSIEEKFSKIATENAPGQEVRHEIGLSDSELRGECLEGIPVDFSHGDVNVDAFVPSPGSLDEFTQGVMRGGAQAYTEYRGSAELRDLLAERLSKFSGAELSGVDELIITPGTQSALFLAIAATVTTSDKVAIVRPDYFANRKLVEFMGGNVVPVRLDYLSNSSDAGLDMSQLEAAFQGGARVFLFSNPNNPTGVVYSKTEIETIAALADRYGATVIVDQLYSRLLYSGIDYWHLRAMKNDPDNIMTIMGPSKTESLSGYRLGVAFGSARLIDRMEKLQAIVSLRAPGYCQAVMRNWFAEPTHWLQDRIEKHQEIRDGLLKIFLNVDGLQARAPQAGSYLFPQLPSMGVDLLTFVRILRHRAAVTVTPGTEFSPHATDSVRLNFSQNRQAATQAALRIVKLVELYRS